MSAWWLSGWQRKYRAADAKNIARVWLRLIAAEDRYQRENQIGRYASPER